MISQQRPGGRYTCFDGDAIAEKWAWEIVA
jgi:hypothetical protein